MNGYMKQKKRILVLTDQMPWGHRSIARAIFNFLKKNEKENEFEVFYAEVKAESGMAEEIYKFYYKYYPKMGKFFYKINNISLANKVTDDLVKRNLPELKKVVERIKPDLIISAYFLHSRSLAWWRKETNKKFKLWTVVADPRTVYSASVVPDADLHLVYDKVVFDFVKKMGVDENKILMTGWWVRPEMYEKVNKNIIRKKLGINDDRPVIFMGGGSLGTSSLIKMLPTLTFVKKKVALVFNTGTDKLAYELVKKYSKILSKLRKDEVVIIKNFGWIDNMAEILGAVDIVFGKAGPNFLFDCVACRKPFVAITHIGGQEDGNIDLIKEKKLGWIKEKSGILTNFLYRYLENPKHFENKFKKTIEKEALVNKDSLKKVLDRVKKDLF